MPALDLNSIAALLVSALLLTWFWARRRSSGAPRRPAEEDLDTVQDWPPQVVRVLTLAERQAYDLLRKSLPGRLVLAQVPLARFISVPTRNSYTEWLNRAGRLSVDLVVCDHSSRVIAAIDIRAPNETPRTRQRHARMGEVLRAAGVVVHEWNAQALPTASQVRTAFMPDSMHGKGAEAEMAIGPGGKRLLPVPEMTEVLATGDAAAESVGMPLEPVSSDYFDDLDVLARSGSGRA